MYSIVSSEGLRVKPGPEHRGHHHSWTSWHATVTSSWVISIFCRASVQIAVVFLSWEDFRQRMSPWEPHSALLWAKCQRWGGLLTGDDTVGCDGTSVKTCATYLRLWHFFLANLKKSTLNHCDVAFTNGSYNSAQPGSSKWEETSRFSFWYTNLPSKTK